jgi:hypothetical protein
MQTEKPERGWIPSRDRLFERHRVPARPFVEGGRFPARTAETASADRVELVRLHRSERLDQRVGVHIGISILRSSSRTTSARESASIVFKALRWRLLCAMGKHEVVYCEDIPIVGLLVIVACTAGFSNQSTNGERLWQKIALGIVAAAIFAVPQLLVNNCVGLIARKCRSYS